MKAAPELSNEECKKLSDLTKRVLPYRQHLHYTRHPGYAHYKFEGNYDPQLETLLGHIPTSDEIIIMVDGGYFNFGASCSVNASDHSFHGKVNTD